MLLISLNNVTECAHVFEARMSRLLIKYSQRPKAHTKSCFLCLLLQHRPEKRQLGTFSSLSPKFNQNRARVFIVLRQQQQKKSILFFQVYYRSRFPPYTRLGSGWCARQHIFLRRSRCACHYVII